MSNPSPPRPPAISAFLLRLVLPSGLVTRTILGDLHEEFGTRVAVSGGGAARAWYRREAAGIALRALRTRLGGNHAWDGRPSSQRFIKQSGGDSMVAQWVRDLGFATRSLMKTPSYLIVTVLTLGLGIGANAAVFTVVKSVLLDPLPFRDADELVMISSSAPAANVPPKFGVSSEFYVQYQEAPGLVGLGLYTIGGATLRHEGTAEQIRLSRVSADYFETLGVQPILGRLPTLEEAALDTAQVMVISNDLWRSRFGSDESVIGKTVEVAGVSRTVIGVMGSDFRFPERETAVWLSRIVEADRLTIGQFGQQLVGRLRPGTSPNELVGQLQPLADRLPELYSSAPRYVSFLRQGQYTPVVEPLKESIVGDLQQPLWILLGTVGFVLLIVCANVANLFLVRAESRRRELAVRAALGATRSRLVRLHFAEALVLAGLGGGLGVALAWGGVPALLSAAPDSLPRIDEIRLDLLVLMFTAGVSLFAALMFGLLPAVKHSSSKVIGWLKDSSRGTSVGRERHMVRNALVVIQSGLALVLLVGSGLLVESFRSLRNVDPGFNARDLLTFHLSLPADAYPDPASAASFHQRLADALRGLPGVESVSATLSLPLYQGMSGSGFEIENANFQEQPPIVYFNLVAPDFFETMQITLLSGRSLVRSDQESDLGNVVISRTMAEMFWPDQDPIGKRLRAAGDSTGWETVVGVVEDIRDLNLRTDPKPIVYMPLVGPPGSFRQTLRTPAFIVRARNPEMLTAAARTQVRQLDSSLPIYAVSTMDEVLAQSVVRLTFTMIALVVSAVMALVLGSVGLYGVLSYVVSQRTQEIGLRLALGAGAVQVRRMVVAQGARLAAIGLVLGVIAAAGLTRLLQGLLYGTEPLDLATFVLMSATMLVVSLLASYLPARRASGVDPMMSMRLE